MTIKSIWLQDFRCFENLELFFSDGLNWIHGNNGSGKTSILEAVYWCGRARSFRTSQSKSLIAKNKEQALVRLDLGEQLYLGSALYRKQSNSFRYKGKSVKRTSELNQYLAAQFLGPQSHRLVEPEPDARRHWLDWSLFHVKHSYLNNYLQLKRCFAQRNQALRTKQSDSVVKAFDSTIANLSVVINRDRQSFIEDLIKELSTIKGAFDLNFDFSLSYKSSIPENTAAYILLLDKFIKQDRNKGFTWHSPFRSKLLIESEKQAAAITLSRGQQKLVAFILLLAQQRLLLRQSGRANILLVDDLHAELDANNRLLLSNYLKASKQQVLVTSTEQPDQAMDISAMFHVEHGQLITV